MSFPSAAAKVERGQSLDAADAAALLAHTNLTELGILAHGVRLRRIPGRNVTYSAGGAVPVRAESAQTQAAGDRPGLTPSQLARCIALLNERGTADLCLYPAPGSSLSIEDWEDLLARAVRTAEDLAPGMPVSEVARLVRQHDMPADRIIGRLVDAGLGILHGEAVGPAPETICSEEWTELHCLAHRAGLASTAAIPSGIESVHEQVEHLLRTRELQEQSGRFLAFGSGPTGCRGTGDPLTPAAGPGPVSSFQYLRLLAVSGCMLQNVPHIQGAWESQGAKIGEVALRFGADDFGAVGIVPPEPGTAPRSLLAVQEVERLIRDSGFVPWRRDGRYQSVALDQALNQQAEWSRELPLVS